MTEYTKGRLVATGSTQTFNLPIDSYLVVATYYPNAMSKILRNPTGMEIVTFNNQGANSTYIAIEVFHVTEATQTFGYTFSNYSPYIVYTIE